ncbi:hypothetical protein NDU88_005238 [Pleurodeles waltl]|uniref:Uncharacterized protein n=1 Tax=Pleurodeles waltl TaxID=8319 RepID=A0AAV7RNI6_PLEWA|nr:hypothetical protein NDU88_005238 [Pleurodeles waltl]
MSAVSRLASGHRRVKGNDIPQKMLRRPEASIFTSALCVGEGKYNYENVAITDQMIDGRPCPGPRKRPYVSGPPLGARAEAPEWGTRGAPPDRKYAGGPGGHWDRAPHAEPRGLGGRLGGEALRREGGPGVSTQRRSTGRLRGDPPDGGRTGNPGEHWGAKSHGLEEATPPPAQEEGPCADGTASGRPAELSVERTHGTPLKGGGTLLARGGTA